jgi:regulator of replication initiation timing
VEGERMLEEKTLDDILAAWSKEFQKQDPNYERILKRKSKDNLIQTISLEGHHISKVLTHFGI